MATGEGVVPRTSYTIGGVKVEFPCKAYPTQLSMMSMIIKGIERRQNCLLESPTGSGKSLALLCSCLAWQQNEYKKRNEEDNEAAIHEQNECQEGFVCTCDCSKTSPHQPSSAKPCTITSPPVENGTAPAAAQPPSNNGTCQPLNSNEDCCRQDKAPSDVKTDVIDIDDDDEDDTDFQPSKKRYRTPGAVGGASKKSKGSKGVVFEDPSDDGSPDDAKTNPHTETHWQMKLKMESVGEDSSKSSCPCPCHSSKGKDLEDNQKEIYKRKKIPRIYFGTRTHKQIAQIVRELGRTAYKNVPMCILGSREHTCVHPDVSKSFNKNDGCKELLEGRNGRSCRYYNGAHKIKNQWQLRDRGLTVAWDIEDLVSLGKKIKACPYFAVRSLKDEADIIFCPYNYLVDPMIRMTMDINMKNQIVVLDEAHNIEDSAREAASCSVSADQLEETVTELDNHIKQQWREHHCKVMHTVAVHLLDWVQSHSTKLTQRDFETALRVWSGSEIVGDLSGLGITKDTLGTFQHHLAAIVEEAEPIKKEQENGVTLSSSVGRTLQGLFLVFEFLFKDEMKYMKDFKVAIVRTAARNNKFHKTDNRWISKKRSSDQSWTLTLNFWCLNPAVAFTDFGEEVRSIILTSGTLSPMSSFQSELGLAFPIQLEANHVVHMSQVWVGTVAIGTNGGSLNGSYKNAETYSFQDEIGILLLQVCQVVPYGVLCFLPSYGMMSKLSQRWKNTGLWDQLEKVKVVMSEARGSDKVNFDEHLREFYEVIKDCENTDIENQSVTGAVCLAVCRGKVSEGMDFADNNARAVMTIGIPFPSIKDTQVELKRQYNDQYSSSRGLLTGSEWYEIQAYRAINQALGRCIRHKRDWGALILVDDRFGRNPKKYITGLSKWVRGKVVHHTHAKNALASLDEFAKARQLSPCPQLPSLSMCASPSPSQPLNATFTPANDPSATPVTLALPITPMSAQPFNHNDSVLRATALQFQPSQSPATPSMTTPNLTTPNLATLGLTTRNLNKPNVNTSTPIKFYRSAPTPSTPFAFGSSVMVTDPTNTTQTVDTGGSVEKLDKSGKTIVKPILGNQGSILPVRNQIPLSNNGQNIPPPRAVVSSPKSATSMPSVETTSVPEGESSTKSNFTLPLQSDAALKEDITKFEVVNKSSQEISTASSSKPENTTWRRTESSLSPETVIQQELDDVKTPRGKLEFEEVTKDTPVKGDIHNGREDLANVSNLRKEASQQDSVGQMEIYRTEYDNTPLLFDSDDNGLEDRSPCPKIANFSNLGSSNREVEEEDKLKEDNEGVGKVQRLRQATPVKSSETSSPIRDPKARADHNRASAKKAKAANLGTKEEVRQTRSRGKMLLRRSSRSRGRSGETCSKVDEDGEDKGDFLDDISCNGSDQRQKCNEALCRVGLFCASCNCRFTDNLDGVSCVSEDKTVQGLSYVASQAELAKSRTRKLGHQAAAGDFCQCLKRVGAAEGTNNTRQADSRMYRISAVSDLQHLSTEIENPLRSQRDFALNAHWSDTDQCCYQPITCAVCRSRRNVTPVVIGYKLVAVGQCHNKSIFPGQVWLFPKDVTHCQHFVMEKESDRGHQT